MYNIVTETIDLMDINSCGIKMFHHFIWATHGSQCPGTTDRCNSKTGGVLFRQIIPQCVCRKPRFQKFLPFVQEFVYHCHIIFYEGLHPCIVFLFHLKVFHFWPFGINSKWIYYPSTHNNQSLVVFSIMRHVTNVEGIRDHWWYLCESKECLINFWWHSRTKWDHTIFGLFIKCKITGFTRPFWNISTCF